MNNDLIKRGLAISYAASGLVRIIDGEKWIRVSEVKQSLNDVPTEPQEGEWIMLSEKQPTKSGYYITSTIYNQVYCDYWSVNHFERTETVLAWMPLPEPYKVGGA